VKIRANSISSTPGFRPVKPAAGTGNRFNGFLTAFFCACAVAGAEPQTNSAPAILQELRSFRELGTVLMVAAHPDDEDRPLLAFLSKGCDFRTGYLSINRGDGGQNEIGPEFDAKLGVIRTQELLAGRRIDGARQFFTRAIDFGYSKSMDETLRIWDHQAVLGDVVRVIRTFRPDVIVTRFTPVAQPGNHGHHNASALLAVEAFKIAGDPKSYPEQLAEGLTRWQPTRIVQDGGNGLSLSGGNTDPASGETVQAIAARTSAQHKTQGLGGFGGRGGGGGNGNFRAGFNLLDGAPGTNLMDGVDTTWNRIPGGGQIAKLADEIIARFDANNPDVIMKLLLVTRVNLASLPADPQVDEKRKLLEKILQDCLGLSVVSTVARAENVAGEELKFHSMAAVKSKVPLFWLGPPQSDDPAAALKPGESAARDLTLKLPANMPVTEPYWLREDPTVGMYRVDDPRLIGRPETPPVLLITNRFQIGDSGGPIFEVVTEPVQAGTESGAFEARRTLKIIPPVSLHCEEEVRLFTPGSSRTVTVTVTAARENISGELTLAAPDGWKISPEQQPFSIASAGSQKQFSFSVTAPQQAASAKLTARAKIGGQTYDNDRIVISYPHIPMQLLQPTACVKAVSLDFATRGKNVGYLPGAGDDTAEDLTQLGYAVTTLTGADLTPEKLRGLDAVVIGVRAFNERTDFATNFPALLAWVEQGGTVIAQYNRPNGLRTQQLGPYPLSIQGQAPPLRVTDENAPVTFLLPDHPALNVPNKIAAADFAGWVQERGAYFASQWDERYAAPLAMSDPGQTQPNSSLLIAKHGNGYYVYTSLAFFRQLPAGVPGAYRLFANLVSLGK
jgi:LmbE family N-acetylglucosaminyl deacetylase